MILGVSIKRISEFESGKALTIWHHIYPFKFTKKDFKVKNLLELTVSDFVDLERFLEESNYIDFCFIFVKKFFWQTVCIHNLESIILNYNQQIEEIRNQYQWVFNPPQYGEASTPTIGDDLRADFVKEFGNWVVLVDKVCKGDITKYKEVEGWKVEEFLFWANYLSGQKIIENVK